ncbi:MAG: hypothetical protein CVT60_07495 [Actinobacteria bacterium HGW-Actinobacteria-10]|jgi:hypothetical protein|nr:MAG: hypothetical protein CVT60_07495 [Actinobacteria bacterium HGW-Actinobacteria-10]
MNRFLLIVSTALCAALLAAGCSGSPDAPVAGTVGPARPPTHVDRTTPGSAVRAYLDGITYTYRMANSDAASDTMTPYEFVRVDAYVELNRQEGRALEQTLTAFDVREVTGREPTMTVSTHEEWLYRYFSVENMEYLSEDTTATYEADYTVIRQDDGLWLVNDVEVTPIGEVK